MIIEWVLLGKDFLINLKEISMLKFWYKLMNILFNKCPKCGYNTAVEIEQSEQIFIQDMHIYMCAMCEERWVKYV